MKINGKVVNEVEQEVYDAIMECLDEAPPDGVVGEELIGLIRERLPQLTEGQVIQSTVNLWRMDLIGWESDG